SNQPRLAERRQQQRPVGAALDEIVGDRVFPGAIERAGAAPGIAQLGIAARPLGDPFQELQGQEFCFARHGGPRHSWVKNKGVLGVCPIYGYGPSHMLCIWQWNCAISAILWPSPRKAM